MLKAVARLFSYIFHPLLLLTYLLLITMNVNPYLFGTTDFSWHSLTLIQIFFSTALLPSVAIIVMERLGIIVSLGMHDKQDRIGPYIVSGIFYLWIFVNVRDNGEIPLAYRAFVLAATLALFLSFLINLVQKVNIHAVAAGVFLSAIIIMLATFNYTLINMTAVLMLAILITGLIGTTQLILHYNHEPEVVLNVDDEPDAEIVEREIQPIDIYGGYLIGFVAMAVAIFFIF
ncbi:MAG: hypothetical protein AB8G11_20325 [Saprospiraceae bacterium]